MASQHASAKSGGRAIPDPSSRPAQCVRVVPDFLASFQFAPNRVRLHPTNACCAPIFPAVCATVAWTPFQCGDRVPSPRPGKARLAGLAPAVLSYERFHGHQQQNSLWQPGILFHRRRWFSSPNAAGRKEPLQRAIATDSAYPPASPQLCRVPIASWPVGSFLAGSTLRGTPDFPLATNLSERVCRIARRARPERRPRRGQTSDTNMTEAALSMGRIRRTDLEDPSHSRPAHTNTSISSSAARPVKTTDAETLPSVRSTTSQPSYRSPKLDQSSNWGPRSSSKTTLSSPPTSDKPTLHASHVGHVSPDGMLSTPLVDYRHAANQSNKARAAAEAAKAASKAQRASSSNSGNSGERKNGSRARPSATRGDQQGRSSSISSTTGSSSLTTGTRDAPPSEASITKPFTERFGRRYLRDPTLPYPLPCDLPEIHRQTLRTLLLCQVFNGPICSPAFDKKPPKRVLEVGCGSGFWSVMCHRYFARRGFNSIAFTGIDIAPIAPRMDSDDDMNWRFVQHDLRKLPLPFRDEEFNLIMTKDMSMVTPATGSQQKVIDEYLRVLKPGGTLEIWDGDHCLRMLLPHLASTTNNDDDSSEDEEQAHSNAMGVYALSPQTPLGTAQNQYIQDYNGWMAKAMEARKLTHMPCTDILPLLLQESEILTDVGSRRLAIPLGEVRWEREGVGGTITQGSNGISTKKKGKGKEGDRRVLTAGQVALRRTALGTFVSMIESLEPVLREASGKDPSEWDRWQESMMNDLLNSDGTSWGECLEVCAGWARKKKPLASTTN